jgi:catechol 2,3-dioxygenase-like lactoylglutathione lyase family enzyme
MPADSGVRLGQIGQISVTVKDIERAVAFYRDVLGITHLFTFGQLAFLDCAGTRLMLDALPEAREQGTSVLYFQVPDIHQARASLGANGVAFQDEPHIIHTHDDGTEEWMAFFRDPDGNPMGLMAQRRPATA